MPGLSFSAQHILFPHPQFFHMLFLGATKLLRSQMKEISLSFPNSSQVYQSQSLLGTCIPFQFIEKLMNNMYVFFLKTASSLKAGFSCDKSCISHSSSYNILKPRQLRYFNALLKAQEGTPQTALIGLPTWKVSIIFMLRTECSSKDDFPRILFIATEGNYWILYSCMLI